MAAHLRHFRRAIRDRERRRQPRLFRDRSNPLEELREEQVFDRYRFRPQTIMYILRILPDLSHPTNRNMALPPLLQLLLCLRFLANGALHLLVADCIHVSRETAGRCIRNVARLIANMHPRFVKFPTGQQAIRIKHAFASIAGTKIEHRDVICCIH